MKINPSASFEQYQKYVQSLQNGDAGSSKGTGDARIPINEAANTDKVMFSENASARAEVSRMATSLAAEVDSLGHSERLAALKTQVENGTYNVQADTVAGTILDRFA